MIVLCEPPRPAGFVSGGYHYQAEVMAALGATGNGELRVVAPERLAATIHELRRQPTNTLVVDGLFAEHAPLPAGTIALLHTVPGRDAWCEGPCPVLATAVATVQSKRVLALATACEVVEPGLSTCFRRAEAGQERAGRPLRIVCVGTFGPDKGQAALWRAVATAPVPCELVLLGAGTERFAAAEQGDGSTILRGSGVVAPEQVASELHAADLCVSWSRSESFGMAVAEAVACGTPVLAFATGAIPTLVQDGGNGWLLPVEANDAAMTALLHDLVQQPARLQQARERAAAPALASWPVVAERFAAACARLAVGARAEPSVGDPTRGGR